METWSCIWIISQKSRGKFSGMHKCYNGEVFFLSAEDAFQARNKMDPEISKSFGVFEVPILQVFELKNSNETHCENWKKLS